MNMFIKPEKKHHLLRGKHYFEEQIMAEKVCVISQHKKEHTAMNISRSVPNFLLVYQA